MKYPDSSPSSIIVALFGGSMAIVRSILECPVKGINALVQRQRRKSNFIERACR
ncbi:uncharacterized protein BDW43DRAFT_258741 [Aspergillus alliaceus]|uniref:uncharacterized protein n=1 Tax=Petromyces alliaceus TaxID=209559 RepID=UPI0012A728BB|nr:uncharacterized protein BDW43DRAFT_258741 [Aspergillus alliaceus]KAB8239636.1 hypothetical protein BDW43DRAFT_258741 [Aspergillus alliaceus]